MDYSNKTVLTEKEVAKLFNLSTSYLQKKRMNGGGSPYYKVGGRVYYRREEVEAYLTGTRHLSTAEYDTTYKQRSRKEA